MERMTLADPPRQRPRPFWSDTRFLLGVLLVAASVAGVWLVVSAARQTVPALAAARTIVPGEIVSGDDLRVVDVGLGALDGAYLTPGTIETGTVATRTIGEGELIPVGAVGDGADARVTTVVVETAADVPVAVGAGARVEVWHAPPREGGVFDPPRILVADAVVAAVSRDDAVIGGADVSLELVVARSEVAALLAARTDGSALSIVPLGG